MADLLTDLKTAYEKLGYQTMVKPDELKIPRLWIRKLGWEGYSYIVLPSALSITPDLCKEMKGWMLERGWYLEIHEHEGRCWMTMYQNYRRHDAKAVSQKSYEEAILAAFLEVSKEGEE